MLLQHSDLSHRHFLHLCIPMSYTALRCATLTTPLRACENKNGAVLGSLTLKTKPALRLPNIHIKQKTLTAWTTEHPLGVDRSPAASQLSRLILTPTGIKVLQTIGIPHPIPIGIPQPLPPSIRRKLKVAPVPNRNMRPTIDKG